MLGEVKGGKGREGELFSRAKSLRTCRLLTVPETLLATADKLIQ
jgi:hypothetical protein